MLLNTNANGMTSLFKDARRRDVPYKLIINIRSLWALSDCVLCKKELEARRPLGLKVIVML